MELTEKMNKVIASMEYLIGSECYNPNSYDGWNNIEGCDFRYPVNVPLENGEYIKMKGNINIFVDRIGKELNNDSIQYMKYKFGSNELYIGRGLISVLEFLEKRYGLDFNKLESER